MILALLIVIGQLSIIHAQEKEYDIDPIKTTIKFSVKHMGLLKVTGTFKQFSGSLIIDSKTSKLQSINSTIVVHSIYTGDSNRDQTLLSDAYLNATKYPFITFKSLQIDTKEPGKITGILQIKDIKKEITLSFSEISPGHIEAQTNIRRSDFELDFGAMNMLIGEEIIIKIEIYKK